LLLGKLGFFGIIGLGLMVVVSQSGGSDASTATIAQSCPSGAESGVTVAFVWASPSEGVAETWLDLGLTPAFAEAASQSYGPFDPAQTAYAIAGLPVGVKYHYRVQALTHDAAGIAKWHTVAAGAFTSACGQPPIAGAVMQRCIEGPEPGPADDGVSGVFTWKPGSAGEQWIDLSVDGGAFATGMYQGYGPVASGAASYEITGIARGVSYHWRVNVRTPGGWLTSAPAAFETLACPRP
jgi:hypothetical protein